MINIDNISYILYDYFSFIYPFDMSPEVGSPPEPQHQINEKSMIELSTMLESRNRPISIVALDFDDMLLYPRKIRKKSYEKYKLFNSPFKDKLLEVGEQYFFPQSIHPLIRPILRDLVDNDVVLVGLTAQDQTTANISRDLIERQLRVILKDPNFSLPTFSSNSLSKRKQSSLDNIFSLDQVSSIVLIDNSQDELDVVGRSLMIHTPSLMDEGYIGDEEERFSQVRQELVQRGFLPIS